MYVFENYLKLNIYTALRMSLSNFLIWPQMGAKYSLKPNFWSLKTFLATLLANLTHLVNMFCQIMFSVVFEKLDPFLIAVNSSSFFVKHVFSSRTWCCKWMIFIFQNPILPIQTRTPTNSKIRYFGGIRNFQQEFFVAQPWGIEWIC